MKSSSSLSVRPLIGTIYRHLVKDEETNLSVCLSRTDRWRGEREKIELTELLFSSLSHHVSEIKKRENAIIIMIRFAHIDTVCAEVDSFII